MALSLGIWIYVYSLDYTNIGLFVFILGTLMNTLVIILNGGYMPVDSTAFRKAFYLNPDLTDKDIVLKSIREMGHRGRKYTILNETTRFKFLTDRWTNYLDDYVYSIGDIFIVIGITVMIVQFIFLTILKFTGLL